MATIVNLKVAARDLRVGDTIIVTNPLPNGRSYSVAADVNEIVPLGKQHLIVFYGACDDPNGMRYGSDVTLLRGARVTRLEVI